MTTGTRTARTPGYTHRLEIWFASDKRGRKAAWYFSTLAGRALRVPLAEAELMAATGTADVTCCHPLRHACGKY